MKKNDEYKPTGYLTLSNGGGVTVQVNDCGDGIRYQWYDEKPSRWQEIKFNTKGAYFTISGRKYYLNEFMLM